MKSNSKLPHQSGIKQSFELGMQSQARLVESFKSRSISQKDDQSIVDDTDSFSQRSKSKLPSQQQSHMSNFVKQRSSGTKHLYLDHPSIQGESGLSDPEERPFDISSRIQQQQNAYHQSQSNNQSRSSQLQFHAMTTQSNSQLPHLLVLRSAEESTAIPKKRGTYLGNTQSGGIGVTSINGDIDFSPQSRDGGIESKQFSNLNDSKILVKKEQISNSNSQDPVIIKQFNDSQINSELQHNLHNNEELVKEPRDENENENDEAEDASRFQNVLLTENKSPNNFKRGSRRIPGTGLGGGPGFGLSNPSMLASVANGIGFNATGGVAASQNVSLNNIKGGAGGFAGFLFAAKMKKYANQLVSRLQSRRYLQLRAKHLHFFNDKTIIPDDERGIFKPNPSSHHRASMILDGDHDEDSNGNEIAENIQQQCLFFLRMIDAKYFSATMKQILQTIPVFNPSHPAKLLWDVLTMMSITFFLIFFPIRIAFGLEIYFNFIPFSALCVLIADSFVLLNTGFYERGVLITDRIGILMHYFNKRLLADLLSLMPFFIFDISDSNSNFFADTNKFIESMISLLFIIRLKHLAMNKKKIEERFYEKKTLMHIISLLSLLMNTIFIAHLLACMWAVIARYRLETSDTWMNQAQVDDDIWFVQYLYSLYFLIVTMTTVGYGDIKPQNNIEHIFIIIIVLIGSVVFSFSINSIGTIVQQMAAESQRVKQILQVINNFMTKKNINMSLQQSIREYLEYYLKESLVNDNETEQKIIDMLSEPLKRQLMIEANKIALKVSPIFRNNFSESTISKTVTLIEDLRCTPEEVIFYEGDIDNIAIFFVQQGKVEIFIDSPNSNGQNNATSLKVFSQGSSFGETSFFTGAARGISIRSIDFTTLLMIKRSAFLDVVKENSDDYENFCKIKDNITFYKNFDDLGIKCISCNSKNHFLNDCPFIHYVPDKEKIIKVFQRSIDAEREPFERKKKIPYDLEVIQESAYKIMHQDIEYLEEQDWYYGYAEDEEEYEFYNQYNDDDDDDDEDERYIEDRRYEGATAPGGGGDIKYYYKQFEGNQQTEPNMVLTSYKEDSYIKQNSVVGVSHRGASNAGGGGGNAYRQGDENYQPSSSAAGETLSHKSGVQHLRGANGGGGITLDVEDPRRDRVSSNLGLNDLQLTPSGLLLNLINPNPGNIRESSQKMPKRKRSNSNSNIHNTPQVLIKSSTLNGDEYNPSIPSNFTPAIGHSSPNMNMNMIPSTAASNLFSKQNSLIRNNSYVRKGSKRKNTEKTLRSTHKRKSTYRTLDSRMNIQTNNNLNGGDRGGDRGGGGGGGGAFERKKMRKPTAFQRKGYSDNQMQNTLLAIQGMENILLQNKVSPNSNEFDVMKSFEIYFPHNNIDVVIFLLRKKNPHLYAKQKSFLKSNTKKLFGGLTMGSVHNRMSKMDIVLQKFLQSEIDEEKDKDSLHSNRHKSFTHNNTHRTPKTQYQINPDYYGMTHSRYRDKNERKHSFNINAEENTLHPRQGGGIMDSPPINGNRRKAKSMKGNSPQLSIDIEDGNGYPEEDNFQMLSEQNSNPIHPDQNDGIYVDEIELQNPLSLHPSTLKSQPSSSVSHNLNSQQKMFSQDQQQQQQYGHQSKRNYDQRRN